MVPTAAGRGSTRVAPAVHGFLPAVNPAAAVTMTEGLSASLAAHGHDERLTALFALRAAALTAIQRASEGADARRLAGEWGAYALGSDHPNVRRWRAR